jgi:sulfite exporter TauE/SafE
MTTVFTSLVSGLLIGLLGSLHCVGMCGPLAMALPVQGAEGKTDWLKILAYNSGRAFTYSGFGFLFGMLGNSFSFFGIQQWLSVVCGLMMFGFVLITYTNRVVIPGLSSVGHFAKKRITGFLQMQTRPRNLFAIGLLNGLLPCGLVYFALTAAMATATLWNGALLMFMFGVGTFPAMVFVMLFRKFISMGVRKKIKSVTPYLISGIALLLIIRGLNLGIPYLSPKLEAAKATCIIQCCK